tara:strand:+ start:192 stop:1004 length:813 start_codon:yes stop_codon:yes gene_type:complete
MSALVVAAARVAAFNWLDAQIEAASRAGLRTEAEGHIVGGGTALGAVEVGCLRPPALDTRAAEAAGTGCVTLLRCSTRHHEFAWVMTQAYDASDGRPCCRQHHLLQRAWRTDRVREIAHLEAVVEAAAHARSELLRVVATLQGSSHLTAVRIAHRDTQLARRSCKPLVELLPRRCRVKLLLATLDLFLRCKLPKQAALQHDALFGRRVAARPPAPATATALGMLAWYRARPKHLVEAALAVRMEAVGHHHALDARLFALWALVVSNETRT